MEIHWEYSNQGYSPVQRHFVSAVADLLCLFLFIMHVYNIWICRLSGFFPSGCDNTVAASLLATMTPPLPCSLPRSQPFVISLYIDKWAPHFALVYK